MAAVAPQSTSQQQRSAEPSMEEILASIRKIIAEDQKVLESKANEAFAPTLAAAPAVNDDDAEVLDLASLRPAPPASAAAVAPQPAPAPIQQKQPTPAPAAPAKVETVEQQVVAAAQPAPQSTATERLISDMTATSTSAAFSSLANAVFTQQARTMDDLVAEMLRPMLTSWLDDHLPALVERLVKAEIERVARGGR